MEGFGGAAAMPPEGYDPATWVPPQGWVAPPGWYEYQQFLQFQRQSQMYTSGQHGYPPGQVPSGYPGAPMAPGSAPGVQQQQAGFPPGYYPGLAPGQQAAGAVPPYPMYPGYYPGYQGAPPPGAYGYGYPPGYYPPQAGPGQSDASHKPDVTPTRNIAAPTNRPPPPPSPVGPRPPRVTVEFEDESSDEEGLARHDTLGVFDLVDIHEISENDFAQLDTGSELNVQDAGIIENGIPVQPAIELKGVGSRESTSIPVQSISVNESTSIKPPPDSPTSSEGSEAKQEQSEKEETQQAPVRRKSTFGAILGAAAALVSVGSRRKSMSRKSSSAGTSQEASQHSQTVGPIAAAAIAAGASEAAEHSKEPASDDVSEEEQRQEDVASSVEAGVAAVNLGASSSSAKIETGLSEDANSPAVPPSRGASFQEMSPNAQSEELESPASPAKEDESASAAEVPKTEAPATSQGGSETAGAAEGDEEEDIVQIKVRTLAGKAAIFEVDKQMELSEFRELIHEHFNNIPVGEQRLLYKGKMIEILLPETTLQDIGFVDGDVIHLVRTVSVNPKGGAVAPVAKAPSAATNSSVSLHSSVDEQQQLQPQPLGAFHADGGSGAQQPLQMLTVLVPPGRGPGDRLRILPHGRGPMLVTVPAGVFAGDRFRVLLPPEDPVEVRRAEQLVQAENQRQQELQRQQEALLRQQQSRPQIMAVVVPKGFKAGQVMDVNVPGKGRVRVTIPTGVKAGQQFKFRLPN